jgi:hypothetical protein
MKLGIKLALLTKNAANCVEKLIETLFVNKLRDIRYILPKIGQNRQNSLQPRNAFYP